MFGRELIFLLLLIIVTSAEYDHLAGRAPRREHDGPWPGALLRYRSYNGYPGPTVKGKSAPYRYDFESKGK